MTYTKNAQLYPTFINMFNNCSCKFIVRIFEYISFVNNSSLLGVVVINSCSLIKCFIHKTDSPKEGKPQIQNHADESRVPPSHLPLLLCAVSQS